MNKVTGYAVTVLLVAASVIWPQRAAAWGHGHPRITTAAFEVLPEWQREAWQEAREGLTTRYCMYPDMGLNSAEAKPYLVVIGGRLFHYFPKDNLQDYRFFTAGAATYFTNITQAVRAGEYGEAAKFAGALAHTLEDLGQPQCHSLEGINGFSWTILDELFTPFDQSWNRAPQSIIGFDSDANFVVDITGYQPQLLGEDIPEAAFRLYQRVCRMRQFARKQLPAALAAAYSNDRAGVVKAELAAALEDAKLVADMFYTGLCLGSGRIEQDDVEALTSMDLTSLVPIKVPALVGVPYRFSPLAYGCAVTPHRQPVPLELWLTRDGEKTAVTFENGIATGCCRFTYEIPPGVFKEFRCTAGQHARLGVYKKQRAKLRLTIKLRGDVVFDSGELGAESLAQAVVVPLQEGGSLEFISEDLSGIRNNRGNHAIWADPVLVRPSKTETAAF